MAETRVETDTQVTIDSWSWRLPPDHDLVELMEQIETAARSGPAFVHLPGEESSVSVLVGGRSKVVITVTRGHAPANLAFETPLPSEMTDWDM